MGLMGACFLAPCERAVRRETEDETMSAHEFRDDDNGYRTWLDTNPTGVVLNIARSHNPSHAKVHVATCWTLIHQLRVATAATKQYVKVCTSHLAELEQWGIERNMALPPKCQSCHPSTPAARPNPIRPTRHAIGAHAAATVTGRDEITE